MKENSTKNLVRHAMLIGLTTAATMLIQVPSLATKGYVNLGDAIVIISGLLLGRKSGFLIGGVGSALADLLLSYTHYVPITLVVKGIEGFLAGYLWEKEFFKDKMLVVGIIAGLWMALGYYICQIPLYGAKAALLSVPGNLIQGCLGGLAATIIYKPLKKIDLFKLKTID